MIVGLENKIIEFLRKHRFLNAWHKVLTVLACMTVFCTTYALILPSITMEGTPICGMEYHVHGEECCNEEGELICTLEEHEHTADCFAHPEETENEDGEQGSALSAETESAAAEDAPNEGTADAAAPDESAPVEDADDEDATDEDATDEDLPDEFMPEAFIAGDGMFDGDICGEDGTLSPEDDFALMAAPGLLKAPRSDYYSSDLAEFVTEVELTDADGNLVDLTDKNAEVTLGERYSLSIHFDEDPNTDNLRQFCYDEDGFLTYDLDALGLLFDYDHSVGGDITIMDKGNRITVGHYTFIVEPGTGRHIAQAYFDDVDDRGNPTPGSNFIDHVGDAGFGLEFAVTFDADDDDEDINLNLGATWNVTLKKNDEADLIVNKVQDGEGIPYEERYPKYDEATHSMLYKVVVECTKGAVDNIEYSDSGIVKVMDVEYGLTDASYSNYSDFVVTDLDGNILTIGDSFDCLSAAAGPIVRGEGYIIYYRMKAEPPGREDIFDQAAAVYATVDNTIAVDYRNPSDPSDPCPTQVSKTSTKVSAINLSKESGFGGATDAFGHKILNWYIVAGGKGDHLTQPFVLQDTIGAGHSFYPGVTPRWELIDTQGVVRESGTFTDANFTADGKELTFSLPHDTDYRFRVLYSTVADDDSGGIYANTVEVPEKDWTVTNAMTMPGGTGSMTKEVSASDSEYVYYTITANIPHNSTPFQFYFTDKLYSVSESTKIENMPEDFTVRVEYYDAGGTQVVQELSAYDSAASYAPGDDEVRYFYSRTPGQTPDKLYAWQLMFFKGAPAMAHPSTSKWYFNDYDCVLKIDYKIPKSAEVFLNSDDTIPLRAQLAAGKRVTNQVWFNATYNASVDYTEPEPVTKRGRVYDFADGKFLYEVAFTNDIIPAGETNPKNYLPLCENFVNAVFVDDFDETMKYVPGSLMAFVYKRSDNTQYCYIGSHYGIADNNPGNSPNIEAIFRYNGPDPTGSSINAAWDDFVYEKRTENYGYIYGHLYRDWSLNEYFRLDTAGVHDSATLEDFANVLKNSRGENDTAVVFLYQLQVRDENKLDTYLDLQNEARVKWDQPDSGTYVSPPAVNTIHYDTEVVKKNMDYQGGDTVSYEIIINPYGIDLTADDTMVVKDEMCRYLEPYMATLKVYEGTPDTPAPIWGAEIEPHTVYNAETNVITMTLPDNVPLRIIYNCLIHGVEEGEAITLDNSVSLNGTPNSVKVNHANVTITASSSTGTGTDHYMYLQKQDPYYQPLNGAEFALYGSKATYQNTAPDGVPQEITVKGVTLYYYSTHTTQDDDENAYLHGVIRLNEESDKLESRGLYALVETAPPPGFDVDPTPMYFYWLVKPDNALSGIEVCVHEMNYAFVDNPVPYTLPETGSSAGLLCMCLAFACLFAAAAIKLRPVPGKRCAKRRR